MEQETLFTASKWEILKQLERGALSPIELASLSRTSVANISQQLRLLEMAGLVTSKRIPNRDKGQPRILYSLAGNSCYMIAASSSFVDKKRHAMTRHNKAILKIWFYPDQKEQYFLEKAFWNIDYLLGKADALAFTTKKDTITFHVFSQQQIPDLNSFTVTNQEGESRTIQFKLTNTQRLAKQEQPEVYSLYDPKNLVS